jgi:hypothetical protein
MVKESPAALIVMSTPGKEKGSSEPLSEPLSGAVPFVHVVKTNNPAATITTKSMDQVLFLIFTPPDPLIIDYRLLIPMGNPVLLVACYPDLDILSRIRVFSLFLKTGTGYTLKGLPSVASHLGVSSFIAVNRCWIAPYRYNQYCWGKNETGACVYRYFGMALRSLERCIVSPGACKGETV